MESLLIQNGRVWDGECFSFADVLVKGKQIVRIEQGISESAQFLFDAAGKTVLPGLVDIHTHLKGITSDELGVDHAMGCLPFGVTAAADAAGGYGSSALLDTWTVKSKVFISVEIANNRAKLESVAKGIERYGFRVAGIKTVFDAAVFDVNDVTPLRQIIAFAQEKGLIVMVHSSHSPVPMGELLDVLRPGDILTHAYHGGENNAALDGFVGILAAKKRGVVIDAGLAGNVHTDFRVFREAIAAGAAPDTISSDITIYSAYKRGGRYGLPLCMSIARYLGMAEADIFRAVTSKPAQALGMADRWGTLAPGRCADIAVLADTDERFDLVDSAGNRVCSTRGYRNVLTVVNGEVLYR